VVARAYSPLDSQARASARLDLEPNTRRAFLAAQALTEHSQRACTPEQAVKTFDDLANEARKQARESVIITRKAAAVLAEAIRYWRSVRKVPTGDERKVAFVKSIEAKTEFEVVRDLLRSIASDMGRAAFEFFNLPTGGQKTTMEHDARL
jgi:hypothetical protein